ncbi:MAG: adenosine deaminase [Leptospiraceae bacterium]|nr:adenosine deaminase [Leptospiraceae bacterium]
MILRIQDVLKRVSAMNRELEELNQLRKRIPRERSYTDGLEVAIDKQVNDLLNRKIAYEELELENVPAELLVQLQKVDMATASRMQSNRLQVSALEPSASEQKVLDFLRDMPKVELHLHMEACISSQTLAGMLKRNQVDYSQSELEKLYEFNNLQEFIKLFLFILDSIKTPDDFELIFQNLREYLESNNIRYAEVFLAPSRMIQNGLDFNEIAWTLDRLANQCEREGGPVVRYLIDVSRTFGLENASRNLQRVLDAKATNIIGIGLGGAELMGPAHEFGPVFEQARAAGLRAVAHSGEDDGPWSIRDTVEILKAERIGHGTSAIQDPDLLQLLKEKRIPIEICLTSNIFTGKYVRRAKDHPVRRYYDEGLVCTVNTDDPEIFNVTLTDEYWKLYKEVNFRISELVDMNRMGVFASFHPRPAELWQGFDQEIKQLRSQYQV